MQADLKSDDFCGYNQSASPFFWVFQPGQYNDTYAVGEVGVPAAGGTFGSYIRPEIVDISSFLSGRDDILSKCVPPIPSIDELNKVIMSAQPDGNTVQFTKVDGSVQPTNTTILLPKYTKEKKSENALDSIDYNRWQPNLPAEPQNLRFVIEDFTAQRGGTNTRNFVKSAWSNQNNSPYYNKEICRTTLDPARACGSFCEPVNGYPGTSFINGSRKSISAIPSNSFKPPGEPNYPFKDITTQQIFSVGAAACGPNFFIGPNYDVGNCPVVSNGVLRN